MRAAAPRQRCQLWSHHRHTGRRFTCMARYNAHASAAVNGVVPRGGRVMGLRQREGLMVMGGGYTASPERRGKSSSAGGQAPTGQCFLVFRELLWESDQAGGRLLCAQCARAREVSRRPLPREKLARAHRRMSRSAGSARRSTTAAPARRRGRPSAEMAADNASAGRRRARQGAPARARVPAGVASMPAKMDKNGSALML